MWRHKRGVQEMVVVQNRPYYSTIKTTTVIETKTGTVIKTTKYSYYYYYYY